MSSSPVARTGRHARGRLGASVANEPTGTTRPAPLAEQPRSPAGRESVVDVEAGRLEMRARSSTAGEDRAVARGQAVPDPRGVEQERDSSTVIALDSRREARGPAPRPRVRRDAPSRSAKRCSPAPRRPHATGRRHGPPVACRASAPHSSTSARSPRAVAAAATSDARSARDRAGRRTVVRDSPLDDEVREEVAHDGVERAHHGRSGSIATARKTTDRYVIDPWKTRISCSFTTRGWIARRYGWTHVARNQTPAPLATTV